MASGATGRVSRWMERNLEVQGYRCLSSDRRGLRFATGACLPLVAVALLLQSPPMLAALAGVALVAGFTPRHPFDLVWNYAVRHVLGAPPVPVNPVRRRHAFKVGALWLLSLAALFAAGAAAAGVVVGVLLLVACGLSTTAYFCVPSYVISLFGRRGWQWRTARS